MLTTISALPDFRTALERQQYFERNADFFVATVRINRSAYRGEYETVGKARYAAQHVADRIKQPVLIYAVIGESAEWLFNCYPQSTVD